MTPTIEAIENSRGFRALIRAVCPWIGDGEVECAAEMIKKAVAGGYAASPEEALRNWASVQFV